MKKFINRVDHVQWICRLESVERYVAELEAITDAKLVRVDRTDVGCMVYIDWSAGLEVIAPITSRTAHNAKLHEWLETHGEGMFGIAFGVADLDKHKAKLEAKGMNVGPLYGNLENPPWPQHVVIRERSAPQAINSMITLSEIDYADGVIRLDDVEEAQPKV